MKANIMILGTSGAGKSTLINTIMGEPVALVGHGKHGTEKMTPYEPEDLNFRLIDSRGFEYSLFNTQKAVKDMRNWMKAGLKDEKPRIHMLWFCVDATSKRFTKTTFKTLELVKKEWPDIPIIVVLTKSFFKAEDEDNIRMVSDTFEKVARKTGMPKAIIPIVAEPPKGEDHIVSRGIEELIQCTEENLEDAVRDSDEAVRKYDLKIKNLKCQALTLAATTSAGVVGMVPIDFPDGAVLVPIESGLITGISKIYKLKSSDNLTTMIISRIIEAGTVGIIAKTAINQLKLIPGLANIAADILNAIVAGSIVFSIGEASTVIMEKAYIGDIDSENLDWVNNIVESQMGDMIKKIGKIIADQGGKIDPKIILKLLFVK